MERGRPSKYDPKYCEMLIAHMRKGYTFDAFAGLIEVSRSSLYRWLDDNEDFRDTKDRATALSLLHWEGIAMDGVWNHPKEKTINATVLLMNLRNRHNWRMSDNVNDTATATDDFALPDSLSKVVDETA